MNKYQKCPKCATGKLVPLMFGPAVCDQACEKAPPAARPANLHEGFFIEKPWFETAGSCSVELLSVRHMKTSTNCDAFIFLIRDVDTRTETEVFRTIIDDRGSTFREWCLRDVQHILDAFGLPNDARALVQITMQPFVGDPFAPNLAICHMWQRPARTDLRPKFTKP